MHGCLGIFGHEQPQGWACAPDVKRREETAFRRTIASEPSMRIVEMQDVVGELAVQERGGIVTGDVNDSILGEQHGSASGKDGIEFGGGRMWQQRGRSRCGTG